MDDENKLADDVQAQDKLVSSCGAILATARKEQKKTVEEIAGELNLSVTQIKAIEGDQSDGLPESTYVRGYIRSYARLLKLDADQVLESYASPSWQKRARLDDIPRDIVSAEEDHRKGFFTPLKVFVILALAGLLAYLFVSGKLNELWVAGTNNAFDLSTSLSSSARVANAEPQEPQSVAVVPSSNVQVQGSSSSANDTLTKSVKTNLSDDAVITTVVAENAVTEGNSLSEGKAVKASESPVETVQNPDEKASIENILRLIFNDTSWVDIRDSNGERMVYKTYPKGETLEVSSSTSMSVFLGNGKDVSAELNGEAYNFSQYIKNEFARFTIGEAE